MYDVISGISSTQPNQNDPHSSLLPHRMVYSDLKARLSSRELKYRESLIIRRAGAAAVISQAAQASTSPIAVLSI